MDEGDYRGAISQLKEVVRLEPDNFEAHLDLGICYAQKGFYAEAERAYEKARALNAEDLLLNYNLAALYALWGTARGASSTCRRRSTADRQKVAGWLATDPMFDGAQGRSGVREPAAETPHVSSEAWPRGWRWCWSWSTVLRRCRSSRS